MTIQQRIYQELNTCRSIYRIIHSNEFINCYNKASIDEQANVDKLIIAKNKEAVISWIKVKTSTFNIRELQLKAKQLNIANWSKFTKEELLFRIHNEETISTRCGH